MNREFQEEELIPHRKRELRINTGRRKRAEGFMADSNIEEEELVRKLTFLFLRVPFKS